MEPTDFAKPKTSYTDLYAFKKAEAIYDLTYLFLERNIRKSDRTHDQMTQAARSGKQNIAEGRVDSASSKEMEIRLYTAAKGSLHELLNDYKDYMRTRMIPVWSEGHPRYRKLREVCSNHNDTEFYQSFAERLSNEELCNLLLTLIHQTIAMLGSLIELVKKDFLEKGGIKEQMFRARTNFRGGKYNS